MIFVLLVLDLQAYVAKQLLDTDIKIAIFDVSGLEPEPEYQELNEGINSGPSYLSLGLDLDVLVAQVNYGPVIVHRSK